MLELYLDVMHFGCAKSHNIILVVFSIYESIEIVCNQWHYGSRREAHTTLHETKSSSAKPKWHMQSVID